MDDVGLRVRRDADGSIIRLAEVNCGGCENAWWVRVGPEFVPLVCCYCGTKFERYTTPGGETRDMAGRPVDPAGPGV